jgi:hypothetical protein
MTMQPTTTELRPALRSARDDAGAVLAALRSEWIKTTTIRTTPALLAFTLLGGFTVTVLVGILVTDQVQHVADTGFLWTGVASLLAAIGGVLLYGSEVQHGTLGAAVAARPARWILAVAKTAIAALLGLLIGALGLAGGFGGALSAGLAAGDTSSLGATIGWALLFTSLSAVLGLGVGMIVRNSTAAISGVLVWGFVIENLMQLFLDEKVARFLPFVAGNHLLTAGSGSEFPAALAVALTRSENALVFAGYTAVALVLGTVLLYRRDTA